MDSIPETPSVEIKQLSRDDMTPELLEELKPVLEGAYPNSKMHSALVSDLRENPPYFQAFVSYVDGEAKGIVVVEQKDHDSVEYYGLPPIHIKRFTVSHECRGLGLGTELMNAAKDYAFNTIGCSVIFGESNEASGLSFYGKQECLYCTSSIDGYLDGGKRNDKRSDRIFFRKIISDPELVEFRYPSGDGIVFVFCKTKEVAEFFRLRGYVSRDTVVSDWRDRKEL